MDRFDDAFFREAKSQIRELNDGLLAVENDDGDVAVDELFRVAHSLKGSCRIQGLPEAGDLAHTLEDVLGAIRSGEVEPTTDLIDEALDVVDLLEAVVRADANDEDLERDIDAPRESLRSTLDVHRTRPPSADATADGRSLEGTDDDRGDADHEWDPADSGLSDDVVAALEETTEFDDVDALFDESAGGEPDDELDGWGLLDEDATADGEETATAGAEEAPTPSGSEETVTASDEAETPDDPSAFFERTKTELDDEGAIDSLQEEIDAVEFGEFDEDDNYTIDQLMDLEPDDASPEEDVPASRDGEDATELGDGVAYEDDATLGEDVADDETGEPTRSDVETEPAESGVESEPDEATAAASVEPDAAEDAVNEFVFGDPQEDDPAPSETESDDEPSVTDEPESEPMPNVEPATMGEDDGEPASVATADVPDPDSVPDTDLGIDLSDDFDVDSDDDWTDDSQMDVSVDEEMAEFESRFDDLLGGRPGEESGRDGPTFRSAVGTLEESRLDADEFPTAEGIDVPEGPSEFDRLQEMTVGVETADQLLNVAEELSLTHLRLDEAVGPETDEAISEEVSNLLRVVTEYRRTVMDVRLMPLRTAVESIPRTVRDIARSQDKDVELVVEDADVELDRGIIDELRDPLVHVARNAVDHGIEPPDDRVAAGKPSEGTIEIRAERVDDEVVIEISDDGRGIEPEALRQRAVDKGILTRKEARRLGDDETYDLLFEPGFTTREEVTDVSGRGVGMDVVSRTVADLNGTVTVDSEPGEGTTVRLTVPVSIVFTEVLFVEANRETFGIPMSVVEQITETPPIRTDDGRDVVRRSDLDVIGELADDAAAVDAEGAEADGTEADDAGPDGSEPGDAEMDDAKAEDSYPLIRLQSALDMPPSTDADDEGQIVWVRAESERLAIRCDRVVTSREVVVRPYGDLLRDVPGVSGATTLGDGEAVNVLDVGSI